MNKYLLAFIYCGAISSFIAQAAPEYCVPETFGGKGDAITLNTNAIQRAIQQCSERGGGTVKLSPGVWLSGPLQLKNNITLQVNKGATLKASNQEGKFVQAFIGNPARANEAFIFANDVHNIAITGGGTLDGDGENTWWPEAIKTRAELRNNNTKAFTDRFPGIPLANGAPRPWFVEFNNVTDSKLEQLHLTNSPMWNIVIRNSSYIKVREVSINNLTTSPNTDGIDIISSHNVTVSKIDIHTGDDNISIKSGLVQGTAAPSKNITVRDSIMREGHGISIGSETANGIGRVTIRHVTFINTENGVRIKSGRDRGNFIGPLLADHLTMTNVATPILVTSSYSGLAETKDNSLISALDKADVTATTPKISGVNISNLTAVNANNAMIFDGLPESVVKNISLRNIDIEAKYGVQARYVNGKGVAAQIKTQQGPVLEQGPKTSLKFN